MDRVRARRQTLHDPRLLRQFVAVAEALHFHRTLRRLATWQPPFAAAMRRLEAEVGATLIESGATPR